jgi:hypothetical protein
MYHGYGISVTLEVNTVQVPCLVTTSGIDLETITTVTTITIYSPTSGVQPRILNSILHMHTVSDAVQIVMYLKIKCETY